MPTLHSRIKNKSLPSPAPPKKRLPGGVVGNVIQGTIIVHGHYPGQSSIQPKANVSLVGEAEKVRSGNCVDGRDNIPTAAKSKGVCTETKFLSQYMWVCKKKRPIPDPLARRNQPLKRRKKWFGMGTKRTEALHDRRGTSQKIRPDDTPRRHRR